MGFLQDGTKQNAASTIRQWYIDALYTIQSLETLRNSLINQLDLMKNNSDYNEDDCIEVQQLIDDINNKIKLI